jgi:hypothetical protein
MPGLCCQSPSGASPLRWTVAAKGLRRLTAERPRTTFIAAETIPAVREYRSASCRALSAGSAKMWINSREMLP